MSLSSDGARKDGKKPGERRLTSGPRCVVGGCDNTKSAGNYFVYQLPGPAPTRSGHTVHWSSRQQSWIRFIRTTRTFKASTYKKIFVCSGHFGQSQYEPSEMNQYRLGLRKRAPSLLSSAIPHQKTAVQPFPPEWFKSPDLMTTPVGKSPTKACMSSSMPSSMTCTTPTSTPPGRPCSSQMASPTAIAMSTATPTPALSMTTPTSSTGTCNIISGKRKRHSSSSSCTCVCRCRASRPKQSPTKKPWKRSGSIFSRKREIESITQSYLQEKAEEKAKDVTDRSAGSQCSQMMVTRKVQAKPSVKSCRIQVKPKSKSIGLQTDIFVSPPAPDSLLLTTSSTQTTMKGRDMDDDPEQEDEEDISLDEDDDSDWELPDDSGSSSDDMEEEEEEEAPGNIIDSKKYIVFEGNLLSLFKACELCHNRTCHVKKITPKSFGSQLKVVVTCQVCHHIKEWHSQPKAGPVHAGNISVSAAILFGGGSPTKVLRIFRFMNVQTISVGAFMDHQREYLQPSIVRVWKREQRLLMNKIKDEGANLVVGGDGRSDSPGHSAKFGSYTMMDLRRNKVLDLQLVQSNEVKNSNAMEKEGLCRALKFLYDNGIVVDTLVTDRHLQVAKWVRETYPDIDQRFDVWHIAKGVNKKIKAVAKQNDCELLNNWKRSIINHIYWCASSTEDGDGEMIVEKFKSILNHIRNVHEGHSETYPKCMHGEDYPQREWMTEGTKAFDKLSKILSSTRLLNGIRKMSHLDQTSSVESFHSVLLYWCPKMLAYSDTGILCRLYLAGLHWNENGGREQATKKDGTLQYKILYPKPKEGGHTVSRVLTACKFNYVAALMSETEQLVTNKMKLRSEMPELKRKPPLSSKFEHPNKQAAVEAHIANRRFQNR